MAEIVETDAYPLHWRHCRPFPAGPSCSTSVSSDRRLTLDLVVNGENAAGGFGITEAIYNELIDAGADAITLGNHAWDQREAWLYRARFAPGPPLPIFPSGTPNRGAAMIETRTASALVINAMGRIFMDPLDDPFAAVERELSACALGKGADAIVLDMHCEATSEKQLAGYSGDGRVSLVVGTHTHATHCRPPHHAGGTAFMSDVGMTGDFDTVIGMAKDEPLNRFLRKLSTGKFEAVSGPAIGVRLAVETDDRPVLAKRVGAVRQSAVFEAGAADFLARLVLFPSPIACARGGGNKLTACCRGVPAGPKAAIRRFG